MSRSPYAGRGWLHSSWKMAGGGYPETDIWQEVVGLFRKFSQQFGTKSLLMDLSLGRVEAMDALPCSGRGIAQRPNHRSPV